MINNKVLSIGLDPKIVDFTKHPELDADFNADKLAKALDAEINLLRNAGFETEVCFIDNGETACQVVAKLLKNNKYNYILIGAGVRKSEQHFYLFEKLINLVHKYAPEANICFNTGPTDNCEALMRWKN